jgi:hypothetical protein
MEEFKVKSENLKDKLKELIREGNVRRIVLKNPKGRVLLDMPLNAGGGRAGTGAVLGGRGRGCGPGDRLHRCR